MGRGEHARAIPRLTMTDDEADQIAVIDAHFHIWPTTVEEFQGDALLDRPFHVEDYLAATAGRGVVGAIWVEAASGGADGFEETRWVFASAGQAAIIRGAVPWVPVAQADVASYVERLIISAPIPIVGTRYLRGRAGGLSGLAGGHARCAGPRGTGSALRSRRESGVLVGADSARGLL